MAPRDTIAGSMPPPVQTSDRALLLRLDGANAGEVYSLSEESIRIGRHPTTELTIRDRGVSRTHAQIRVRDGVHWIEDADSSNGTYVQGKPIKLHALDDGDVVQLGPRVSFRYSHADSRQEELLRQLFRSSTRDALTGVCNRQHFSDRFAAELAFACRHRTSMAVVLFDIDHFKRVNDTFGHQVGDGVLCHVAGLIGQRMRSEDVFARYGGEEFIAAVRDADSVGAFRVAERMRVAVSTTPAFVEGHRIPVSLSAGCAATNCEPGHTAESLIETADRRLYAAKRAGRNRIVYSD